MIASLIIACVNNKGELPQPNSISEDGLTITYQLHVKKIIDNNCIVCHSSNGTPWAQTPFLTTYNEVKNEAERIQSRSIDESPTAMPPSGSLLQSEKDTLQFWLNQGAKE
jgi:uncharacterized membrane protein